MHECPVAVLLFKPDPVFCLLEWICLGQVLSHGFVVFGAFLVNLMGDDGTR
jgi:hypothetical protein